MVARGRGKQDVLKATKERIFFLCDKIGSQAFMVTGPSQPFWPMVCGKETWGAEQPLVPKGDTERGRDIGRGRSRLPMGNLMWDVIWAP